VKDVLCGFVNADATACVYAVVSSQWCWCWTDRYVVLSDIYWNGVAYGSGKRQKQTSFFLAF
jgi:hypothetical protein